MKHAFDRFVQYLQKNYFSYWIVLGIDTFIALICTWVSFIGIHYITETSKEITSLFHILAISVISSVLGSFLFHTYRNTIRFSQLKELWRIAGTAILHNFFLTFLTKRFTYCKLNVGFTICKLIPEVKRYGRNQAGDN